VLIDASGLSTFLSQMGLTGPKERGGYDNQVAIFSQVSDAVRDEGKASGDPIIFYQKKNHWAWFLPLNDEVVSVGVVVPTSYFAEQKETTRDFLMRDAVLFGTSVRLSRYMTLMDQSASIGMRLLQVATLSVGAWMTFSGSMTVGTLAAFQALHLSVSTSMLYFLEFTRSLLPARAGMQRIDEFLTTGVALADRPGAAPMAPFERAIECRGVSFTYDQRVALHDLGFLHKPKRIEAEKLMEHVRAIGGWYMEDRALTIDSDLVMRAISAVTDPRSEFFELMRRENLPANELMGRRMESGVLAVLGQLHATRNWWRIGREWWFCGEPATELGREEWAYFESKGEKRVRKFGARATT